MAIKVKYKVGTKETYLGLTDRKATALYWCVDTRELYKGDDLYSDGVRVVEDFDHLPMFLEAADGKLYICSDTGNGYVLRPTRDGWDLVIHGVDGETIGYNGTGLMCVKSVPLDVVDGLEDRFSEVEKKVLEDLPIASADKAGIVKPGEEFSVSDDGTLALKAVPAQSIISVASSDQFELSEDGKLVIKNVDSSVVTHHDEAMSDVMDQVLKHLTIEDF